MSPVNALALLALTILAQAGDGGHLSRLTSVELLRRASTTCWVSTRDQWVSDDKVVLFIRRTRRSMSIREKDNPLPKGIPWSCFSKRTQDEEPELRDAVERTTFFAVLVDDDLHEVRLNRIAGRRVLTEPFWQHDSTGRTVQPVELAKELPKLGIPDALIPRVVETALLKDQPQ